MNHITRFRILTYAACACFFVPPAMAQGSSDARLTTQSEVLQSCQGCHGADGNTNITSTPRLNGQQVEYMVARLKKFSTATRNNPHLKLGMFKELSSQSNATRLSLAEYFSQRSPTNAKPGIRAAEGERIYQKGLAAENVIACSLCHGPQGDGHNVAPRIAGQHAQYLTAQLQLFNLKFREHVLMGPNTKTMSRNTMESLTSYLAND